jgi:hypothetical protein
VGRNRNAAGPGRAHAAARGEAGSDAIVAQAAPVRRLPFGRPARVPLALLPDEALEALRYLARGALGRAVRREAALRDGSDRGGPRVEWRPA